MTKFILLISLSILNFQFSIAPVFAQVVGTINPPQAIIKNVTDTNNFISVIVRFVTVIAGLYSMWQFITGGIGYISSGGDKGKVQQSTQQINMAILGLVTIGISFILGSIIGRLLFGPTFDLFNPVLQTV